MQVSSALYRFMLFSNFHFMIRSSTTRTNYICILLQTNVTAKIVTSVVGFIGFHPIKAHPESGNYYEDELLISDYLRIRPNSNFDFVVNYRSKQESLTRNICVR